LLSAFRVLRVFRVDPGRGGSGLETGARTE
jgi:hypothetical protein